MVTCKDANPRCACAATVSANCYLHITCCPKCDVNELEGSLLAHIHWSTLMPDLVNRCITELRS